MEKTEIQVKPLERENVCGNFDKSIRTFCKEMGYTPIDVVYYLKDMALDNLSYEYRQRLNSTPYYNRLSNNDYNDLQYFLILCKDNGIDTTIFEQLNIMIKCYEEKRKQPSKPKTNKSRDTLGFINDTPNTPTTYEVATESVVSVKPEENKCESVLDKLFESGVIGKRGGNNVFKIPKIKR